VRKQIDVLTDDLDDRFVTYRPTRDVVTTVPFGIDGETYEIDLNEKHAAELRKVYAPYVDKGRRAGANGHHPARRLLLPGRPAGRQPRATPAEATSAVIRDWAQREGLAVKPHGRIAAEIKDRYHAAHAFS
jgi:hypothetical protein